MIRRAFLKTAFSIGLTAFLCLDLLKTIQKAFAADLIDNTPSRMPVSENTHIRVPVAPEKFSSLSQAVASGDAANVASFIQKNPTKSSAAPIQEKIEALKLFKIAEQKAGYARNGLNGRADCEKAAVILLASTEKNANERSQINKSLGGKQWLRQEMPKIQDDKLRKIAEQELSK
jgi:hypothetical protein